MRSKLKQQYNIEEVLRQYGLSPNKMLGQNFLLDEDVLDRIVEAAEIQAGDFVLEIGPGIGNLTRRLLEAGAKVFAIERDQNFAPILNALAKEFPGRLEIEWGDALRIQNSKFKLQNSNAFYKVIGNIPYYITGKLVPLLLNLNPKPESITLLVQKEVAERMTAGPGQMSLLALAVQMKSTPELMFVVPAKAFYPAPKVESAVVRLKISNFQFPISNQFSNSKLLNKDTDPGSEVGIYGKFANDTFENLEVQEKNSDAGLPAQPRRVVETGMTIQEGVEGGVTEEKEKQVFKLAKAAFLGKRKTLLNSLSGNLGLPKETVEKALSSCGVHPNTRPQELSIETWLALTSSLIT